MITQDFSLQISLCLKIFLKERSSHQQGKKEVACVVSKPLVSCLWGCGESVNPPKHPGGFRGLCPLDQRETKACSFHFRIPIFHFCQITLNKIYLLILFGSYMLILIR